MNANATSARSARLVSLSLAIYRALLLLYPARFRRAYGESMLQVFRAHCRAEAQRGGPRGITRVWRVTLGDLIITAIAERLELDMAQAPVALYRATGTITLVGVVTWLIGPIAVGLFMGLPYVPSDSPLRYVVLALPIGWLFFVVGFIGLYSWLARHVGALVWLPGAVAILTLLALIVASIYWTYNSFIGVQQMGNVTVVNLGAASVVNQQLDYDAYAISYLAYPALGLTLFVTGLLALRAPELRAAARTLLVMGVVGMLYYFFTDMGAPSLLRNTGTPGLIGMVAGAVVFYGVWLIGWLRLGRWLRRVGAQPSPALPPQAPAVKPALD